MKSKNRNSTDNDYNHFYLPAEKILATALGQQISIKGIEKVKCLIEKGRRNLLLRCFIEPIKGIPSSFILKKVETNKYNPEDAESWDTRRFFNDWIGCLFLNTVSKEIEHSPFFYGGNRELGFILIEDVKHYNSLAEILLRNDPNKAEWACIQYATRLAHLHKDTIGKNEEFARLYKTASSEIKPYRISIDINNHCSRLDRIGIELKTNFLQDLEAIDNTVNNPEKFLAYIHADACPDNILDTGNELRLIDFETGFFGHAFLDAAFARMMFPSCWCSKRLPKTIIQNMEQSYREILIQNCPIAENDDIFETALIHACGFWLLYTISRHLDNALKQDVTFGISTIRQQILARLNSFISTSREFKQLSGLRDISNQLLDVLLQRWSDVSPLLFYPAFTSK